MQLFNKLSLGLLTSLFPLTILAAQEPITLNFKDVDIDSVIGAYGYLLNRTFIIDPRVRGKISLNTANPVDANTAYQLLLTTLRLQGFTIVENGSVSKVVPENDGKLHSTSVYSDKPAAPSNEKIVTQIFKLNYESVSNISQVIRPLMSQSATLAVHPTTNSLIITDYGTNLKRISRIIQSLDISTENEVQVIPVKNSTASDIAVQVLRLLDDSARLTTGPPGANIPNDPSTRVSVSVDTRLNSILIRTQNQARMALAKSIVAQLDQPSSETGNIRVVYLRNAEATKLMQVLKSVLSPEPAKTNTIAPVPAAPNQQSTPQQETPGPIAVSGAIIAADVSTNSLIITAPEPIYRNLRSVIDKLDARRAQVYIESLIVEISAEKSTELGIQWQFLSSPSSGNGLIGGTNLPARNSGSNILDATTNISSLGQGLNIGLVRAGAIIGSAANAVNLGLLARALETEAGANIIATPNLVTLDNEEAKIIIGQNVPFITGSFVNSGAAAGAVNPFQTIERKDVGTTLRVKPQIAEGGTVKMQIFQEVSNVQNYSLAAGLITNKRSIESNVLVDDGQMIVLGGLIEERVNGEVDMVPGLGRVPVLGNLFRYDNRKKVKTNLLVFLRPIVLRDPESSRKLSEDRYDYIQQIRNKLPITPSEIIREEVYWPSAK